MRQFIWHEGDSFLHRLNPLTKLALTVPVTVLATLANEPISPLVMAAAALLATHLLGNVPWRRLLQPLGFSALLGFGMVWSGVLFYAGEGSEAGAPEIVFGLVHLKVAALIYGLTLATRLLAIFSTSMLFVLTTDPVELVLALIHQARLPYRIGYAVFVAYRFMPLVQEELENIRAAHQIRGVPAGRGPIGRMRQTLGYAIPLLAISVRRAERVALAMESRGFGARPDRTYYRSTTVRWPDAAFVLAALALLAAITIARVALTLSG